MAIRWIGLGADGLQCFGSVADAGCTHQIVRTGSGPKADRMPAFKWANTALGNIKAAITGTYRAINSKHLPRLTWAAARTTPMPYRFLKLAEAYA